MPTFNIEPLAPSQIRELYAQLLVPSFPVDELKPLKMIEAALSRGEYVCYGAMDGEEALAAAFFVKIVREGRTIMLVDYFAVRADRRCLGIGGRFLQKLMAGPLKGLDAVLLEVDEPACADTPAERTHRERRLRFYLRNGLIDTAARATVYGVTFRLLYLPVGRPLSPDEARRMYAQLYHAVLPPEIYRQRVFIEGYDG